MFDNKDLFCTDLPSSPNPGLGTILVTGATGYIGGRLVPELLARGYNVRVMVRVVSKEQKERWPGAEIVEADAFDLDKVKKVFKGVYAAYYLIHSLLLGQKKLQSAEVRAAYNFRTAAEENNVKRIIYLGGLGDVDTSLSPHLKSRVEVARELEQGETPVTILRAAIIIGAGSASYELIKSLVKNLPLLFIPSWARTECQPISVIDVTKCLVGVLEKPETSNKSYDIGGRDILTYEIMLKIMRNLLRKKMLFADSPITWIAPYSYIASLATPVPDQIVRALLKGITTRVVCENNDICDVLPFRRLKYKEAVLKALTREEQDNVYTRWSDAYPPAHVLAIKLHELKDTPLYTSTAAILTDKKMSSLFSSISRIGGKEGWFHNNWMWRLRGMVDRIFLGVGTSRGRRSSSTLRINDVIDFWRVEDLKKDSSLLLRAEMKLPGKAWLKFNIMEINNKNSLRVKAYFQAKGILGEIYWFMVLPFHNIIFKNLIQQIEKRS